MCKQSWHLDHSKSVAGWTVYMSEAGVICVHYCRIFPVWIIYGLLPRSSPISFLLFVWPTDCMIFGHVCVLTRDVNLFEIKETWFCEGVEYVGKEPKT